MSAFLGPIHYWLFKKIKFQEEVTSHLLAQFKDRLSSLTFMNEMPSIDLEKPLEEIIDQKNIHGWLQEQIHIVENRFAMVLEACLESGITEKELVTCAKAYAVKISTLKENASIKETYEYLNSLFLDGMPCDHINQVSQESDEQLVIHVMRDIHETYYKDMGKSINIYWKLREAIADGLLAPTAYEYVIEAKGLIKIKKRTKNYIAVMMEEHQNILRMVKVVRAICQQILDTKKVPYEDMLKVADFIRYYADEHHHGKEEKLMFAQMVKQLGRMGENLVTHGMLVEHDLGRLHMNELRQALEAVKNGEEDKIIDVIANAISYTHLIVRHIEKEDKVVYPFGDKNLSKEIVEQLEAETQQFQKQDRQIAIREEYLTLLNSMEEKYL